MTKEKFNGFIFNDIIKKNNDGFLLNTRLHNHEYIELSKLIYKNKNIDFDTYIDYKTYIDFETFDNLIIEYLSSQDNYILDDLLDYLPDRKIKYINKYINKNLKEILC